MIRKQKHLFFDLVLVLISVLTAVFFVETGLAERFISSLGEFKWTGVFIAGMLFTSFLTTPMAIALLGVFALTTPLLILVTLGGVGAVVGDYIIFKFIKDRISEDFKYLLSFSKKNRFSEIFHTRLFKFFIPLLGALIIASPFPDEVGVAMLGISKIKNKTFFLISFFMNSIGILAIGLAARVIMETV